MYYDYLIVTVIIAATFINVIFIGNSIFLIAIIILSFLIIIINVIKREWKRVIEKKRAREWERREK